MRHKKITRLTGKVTDPRGSILAYDTLGRTITLS